MGLALEQAKKAESCGEVPVGAVFIDDDQVIAEAHNKCIMLNDPTAHAEIIAIRDAACRLSNYRLTNYLLITTLEPCIMCMGAMIHARIGGLIFGAREPKAGAVFSKIHFFEKIDWTNHKFCVKEGILATECGAILKNFFKSKRKKIRRGTEVWS